MGVFARIWRVVRDTGGGVEPVPVELERNPAAAVEMGAVNPEGVALFLFRLGLRAGFAGASEARIPVYRRVNDSPHPILKEIHYCDVAGKRLEAANVFALRQKVQRLLETIAPGRTLPLCYFEVPGSEFSLAVYEEAGALVCPVLAGPKIRAGEMADIREPVVRHLRTAGYLGPGDEPAIRVLRPSDLDLVAPSAIIRSLDDPSLWLPTVEGSSQEGPVIGLLSHAAKLQTTERRRRGAAEADTPPAATDVTGLLRHLGAELTRLGHLAHPSLLYAESVRPDIWARTERLAGPTGRALVCYLEDDGGSRLELPVLHTSAGESVVAIQERQIAVFLAADEATLATVVGRYLSEAGFLQRPGDVRAEDVRPAAPEPPGVDEIFETDNKRNQEVTTS